jgi:AraC-like DNA-binding protein
VRFGAKANILRIPVELIHTKNISAEFQNYEHALEQCKELLAIAAKDQTATHARVRRSLLSNPSHQVSESEVAAALFVGKRTLARRLEREGTSFRQVRDGVLSSLAEGYLLNTQLSVEAIAALLNYHDSSSFRRAFKRWNQMPPEQFRKAAAQTTVNAE